MKTFSLSILQGLILLSGLFMFASCGKENSSDVNQDRIYAEYELYYDKNTDKTYASAIFRFGNATGTPLELTAPSQVKFGNDVIPFDPVLAYYRKEYAGQINSGTFTFEDTQGLTFTNTISSYKSVMFPAMDTIHSSNSYTLTWIGDSITANERIDLWIDGTMQNNAELFVAYTLNQDNFVLPANRLANLGIGNATCTMDRVWETDASSVTSAGGKVRAKYRPLNKTVYVTP